MNDQQRETTARRETAKSTRERWRLLVQIERLLEMPMVILGFVWLALLIVELWVGLSPLLQGVVTAIWIIFILDFLIKLIIAPRKRRCRPCLFVLRPSSRLVSAPWASQASP